MSDTISRADAIEQIQVWAVNLANPKMLSREDAIYILESMPSAQPEVIRCKDCKWYGRVDKRRFYRGMDCLQKHIDTIVPDRDFCSKAERRDEQDG